MKVKNILNIFLIVRDYYLLWKYNRRFSKIDYFNYKALIDMPKLEWIRAPFSFNLSYGMFKPAKVIYKGKLDIMHDYVEHGLNYAEQATLLVSIMKEMKIGKIFTYSERRKAQIERIISKEGFDNEVVALGVMITSAPNFHTKKELIDLKKELGKTLLVFPMHSWTGVDNDFDNDELVKEIERLRPSFDTVMVCMYYMDIRKGKHLPYEKKGYRIVCNGDRQDTYFISRHRDIIELADVTMSNGIGTHVGYSIALGRPHYYFKQTMVQKIDVNFENETPEQQFRVGFENEFVKTFGTFSYEINQTQRDFVRLYWGE